MKKILFLSVFALVVVALAALTSYKAFVPKATIAALVLDENIEALTQGESGGSGLTCYSTITSKDGSMIRYCQTCTYVSGTDPWYASSGTCHK